MKTFAEKKQGFIDYLNLMKLIQEGIMETTKNQYTFTNAQYTLAVYNDVESCFTEIFGE